MNIQSPSHVTASPVAGHKICIDPGHGGPDTGAIGPTGVQEKDVNLAIALQVRDELVSRGATVVMTRDTDRSVAAPNAPHDDELQARCNVATNSHSDIFVSIHNNAAPNASANGMETYHARDASDASVLLAQTIFGSMQGSLELRPRGVFPANYYVIHKATMPAELTEVAFVTNPLEEKLLASPDFQRKAATAIADGIVAYYTTAAKTHPSSERPDSARKAPVDPMPEDVLGNIAR